MNVYLDTNLWNELLDRDIGPQSLHAALCQQGKRLALGDHTMYELAQTFAVNHQRGQDLFRIHQTIRRRRNHWHSLDSGTIAP